MEKKPAGAGKSSFDLIDRASFFSRIKILPDAEVLDLACGAGIYSLAISPLLGEKGLIHAVDLWDEGIENLRKAIEERAISNIDPIKADITKHIPLESNSVDVCLMATILHDLSSEDQDSALREVTRILKAEGTLAVIEFKKIDHGPGPPIRIRISEGDAKEIIKKYGFRKTWGGEIGEYNYMITFKNMLAESGA